jgi:hypothetical protein
MDTPRPSYGHGGKTAGGRNEKAELQPVKSILKFCGPAESVGHATDKSRQSGLIFQDADHFGFPVSNSGKLA